MSNNLAEAILKQPLNVPQLPSVKSGSGSRLPFSHKPSAKSYASIKARAKSGKSNKSPKRSYSGKKQYLYRPNGKASQSNLHKDDGIAPSTSR